jgi:hypothetical protein
LYEILLYRDEKQTTYRERRERDDTDEGTALICLLFTSTREEMSFREEKMSSGKAEMPVASMCKLASLINDSNDDGTDPPGKELSPMIESVWSAVSAPTSSGRFCGIPGAMSLLQRESVGNRITGS